MLTSAGCFLFLEDLVFLNSFIKPQPVFARPLLYGIYVYLPKHRERRIYLENKTSKSLPIHPKLNQLFVFRFDQSLNLISKILYIYSPTTFLIVSSLIITDNSPDIFHALYLYARTHIYKE